MTDERRAKALKDYLLSSVLGQPDLSWKSIGRVFLGIELDNPNISNRARRIEENLKTVNGLVSVLRNIKQAIAENPDGLYSSSQGNKKIRLSSLQPPPEVIIRAFQMLVQLTWEERQALGQSADDHQILVNQALLNLTHYHDRRGQERILELYKASIGIVVENSSADSFSSLEDVNQYIDYLYANDDMFLLSGMSPEERNQLKKKGKNAIERMLLRVGTGQIRFMPFYDQNSYVENYLTPAFVKRIVQVVNENNLLNKDFPIYLKSITLNHSGPLPLPRGTAGQSQRLFSKELLEICHLSSEHQWLSAAIDTRLEQLLTQPVSRVVGEFFVRFSQEASAAGSYQPFSKAAYNKLKTQVDDHIRVHFTVQTTGLGGTLSQVVRVINAALFWDIGCLKDDYFFPIAHDVLVNQEIVQKNTPSLVWSHNLVKLCRSKTIEKALSHSQSVSPDSKGPSPTKDIHSYEEFAFIDPDGRGDYCDFDTLTSAAKASLQARLRAIQNAGISPRRYFDDLLHRVEQQHILAEAKQLVVGYPFSSFAMETAIQEKLFNLLSDSQANKFPHVVCEAYLTLTETFLSEGAYRRASSYLTELHRRLASSSKKWVAWCRAYMDNASNPAPPTQPTHLFSGALLVRYELCLAHYYYLLDTGEEQEQAQEQLFLDDQPHQTSVDCSELAWQATDRAEQLLMLRLVKYHVINEISQATFHPYYQLLAKIYLLRARMLIFCGRGAGLFLGSAYKLPTDYPHQAKERTSSECIHAGRLFLLERARLYAACDGDSEAYVVCTAYQCWSLIAASLETVDALATNSRGETLSLLPDECLSRAKKLCSHAILEYRETGRRCYHEVKEQSGQSEVSAEAYASLHSYKIDPIPAIRETIGERSPGYSFTLPNSSRPGRGREPSENAVDAVPVLYLDMNILSVRTWQVDPDNPDSLQSIYLFGPMACYLFFMRGLCHLRSDQREEFIRPGADSAGLPLATAEDWDRKFEDCYRLFNYAWAIADNGCKIESVNDAPLRWKIKRYSHQDDQKILDAHIASVWALYPYRVSEIDDLGKVLAAACAALRIHTAINPEAIEARKHEISWLFHKLHREEDIRNQASSLSALAGQKCYNGHLRKYIDRCKRAIQMLAETAPQKANKDDRRIPTLRDRLLRDLFDI